MSYLSQYSIQHGHVSLLSLDGVGEEAVGLVGYQQVDWCLFHAEYHIGFADVFLNHCSSADVGLKEIIIDLQILLLMILMRVMPKNK